MKTRDRPATMPQPQTKGPIEIALAKMVENGGDTAISTSLTERTPYLSGLLLYKY
jgi:hypothetical protein